MSDYFDQVAAELRAAADHRTHLPWYRRFRRTRARGVLLVAVIGVIGAGTALAATGTFDSATTVVSSRCETTASFGSRPVEHPCVFVLGDGTRFSCPPSFARTLQTADTLEHATACKRVAPLAIPVAWQPVVHQIQTTGTCIAGHGFQVSGSPLLGQTDREEASPIGELLIQNANHPILIGFYVNSSVAQQSLAGVTRAAGQRSATFDRHGNIIVAWTGAPSQDGRSAIEGCAFH